jgi:ferredoxin-NADP reductase
MVGQMWTLDGDTDVVITDLAIEAISRKVRHVTFRKPDGAVKAFKPGEFLPRAVYIDG